MRGEGYSGGVSITRKAETLNLVSRFQIATLRNEITPKAPPGEQI